MQQLVSPPAISTTAEPSSGLRERLTAAVDIAREAVVATGEGKVGPHQAAISEDANSVTHYFAADIPGYHGWQWSVVVAGLEGDTCVTVSEVALLPGSEALTAPQWVPWDQRIQPGDLSPGDVLAAPEDDHRLVPNQIDSSLPGSADEQVVEVNRDLGLGRRRVLSREGRVDAAERWLHGEHGPDSEMASSVRYSCFSCGFYLPLAGSLRAAFGVCANEFSADGQVVHADYGCGAHSSLRAPKGNGSPAYDAYDDGAVEIVQVAK